MHTLDKLFELLLEKTGLKRVAERPYGHIHYTPSSAIAVRVKKKSISIEFYTDGRTKNSLTPDEHINWANACGILRLELFSGGFFVLRRGVKNNLKSTLIYELPIGSEDSLSNPDLQYELVGVINALKQNLDGFVTLKSKGRREDLEEAKVSEGDEEDSDEEKEVSGDSNESSISSNYTVENLLEAISDKIMETGILTQYIDDGSLATVSLKIDSSEDGFEIVVIIDCNDRSLGELSDDEDDYICERLDIYFEQKGFWAEFDSLGYPLDDFLGFITEVQT
tara:strand:+ start:689 stop:1528 length:840 start_codon:yes stop_codon:yes gene_type:complete